jgi:hypothetical protein
MLLLVTHCTSFSILCEIETANRRHLNNSPEAEMFPARAVLPGDPFFSRVPRQRVLPRGETMCRRFAFSAARDRAWRENNRSERAF